MADSRFFKRFLILALTCLCAGFSLVSCGDKGKDDTLDVQFEVPESIIIESGVAEMQFRVMFGKAPIATDKVVLEDYEGTLHTCDIINVSDRYFTISLNGITWSGQYNVYIQRGSVKKLMGSMNLSFSDDIDLEEGNNVYGIVSCGRDRLKDVVVSDGVEVVKTDENGVYQFKSSKKYGYVFVSVPSGYEVASDGVLPKFSQSLTKSESVPERIDFMLSDGGDQSEHTILVFGDMHLANRGSSANNDMNQFRNFTSDVKEWMAANPGKKLYGLALGDMTWDIYWVTKKYDLTSYLEDIKTIEGLQIWHTIGNHDHSCYLAGDFGSAEPYRDIIGPTFYSFNIGGVHYVVLDDIVADNTGNYDDSNNGRNHIAEIESENINWLKKDLSFIPKTTPIVLAMHAPLYNDSGSMSVKNNAALISALSGFTNIHVITGHTHKMYNIDNLSASSHIYEHNSGAVCATWWWTGKMTPGIHIGQDGAPGGWRIFNVSGTDFSWKYKPTGTSTDLQFRTYDGNEIYLDADKYVPNADASGKLLYTVYASEWMQKSTDNYVYINVWDYDPSWTVSVTEDGKSLDVEQVTRHDPLHIISYTAPSIDGNSKNPTFPTSTTRHMFRVQASSATSTLDIKVTDRFGNVYTERMARPKSFNADIYKY